MKPSVFALASLALFGAGDKVDSTPPTVAITAPAPDAAVSGIVAVSATADDDVGVVGVQFKLDGANLGPEAATPPYAASWDTARSGIGRHVLTAAARDAAGNATVSAPVPVDVIGGH
jgi:hypothetical protein